MGIENKIYAKIDKHDKKTILFTGTMSELCEYTGRLQSSIRAYMSHCAREGKFCPYVLVGQIREPMTPEEKVIRGRENAKRCYERKKLKMMGME